MKDLKGQLFYSCLRRDALRFILIVKDGQGCVNISMESSQSNRPGVACQRSIEHNFTWLNFWLRNSLPDRYQKSWFSKCISFQIWLYWVSMLAFGSGVYPKMPRTSCQSLCLEVSVSLSKFLQPSLKDYRSSSFRWWFFTSEEMIQFDEHIFQMGWLIFFRLMIIYT